MLSFTTFFLLIKVDWILKQGIEETSPKEILGKISTLGCVNISAGFFEQKKKKSI